MEIVELYIISIFGTFSTKIICITSIMIQRMIAIFFMIRVITINLLFYDYWKNIPLAHGDRLFI